jgi:hypothetical protein
MADLSQYFKKNSQIIVKQFEGDFCLIDPYRRALIRLNPVALEIWKLIDGRRSGSEIFEALKEEFEVEEAVLKKDLEIFLSDLVKREIIC